VDVEPVDPPRLAATAFPPPGYYPPPAPPTREPFRAIDRDEDDAPPPRRRSPFGNVLLDFLLLRRHIAPTLIVAVFWLGTAFLVVSGLVTVKAVYLGSTLAMTKLPSALVTCEDRSGTPAPDSVIVAPTTPLAGLEVSTTRPLRNGKSGFCPGGGVFPLVLPPLFVPLVLPPPPPPPPHPTMMTAASATSAKRDTRTWGDCHNTVFLIYLPAFRLVSDRGNTRLC